MKQGKDLAATARAHFEPLVAAAGRDGRKLAALAELASKLGLRTRIYPLARDAQACAPDDAEVAARMQHVIGKNVPKWHFAMMRDEPRNAAFDAAIRRAVTSEARILDIGAGSGLLSMMAARAGAGRVVACEENPAIADVATRIVAANGYADRIHVVAGNSKVLDVEVDLGGRADVIVSEIVSNNLLGEGVLETLADAATRLLAPGGRMIPASGDVMIALGTWSPSSASQTEMVDGFDLSAFNTLASMRRSLDVGNMDLTLQSDAQPLLSFDFTAAQSRAPHRAARTLTATGGPIGGVVQWVGLQLDAQGRYENRPAPDATSHWGAQYYPFDTPLDVPAGTRIRIAGTHDGKRLLLWHDDSGENAER